MAHHGPYSGKRDSFRDRRCHWYDDNGQPRVSVNGFLGCRRGIECNFAHPTDRGWENADKVPPPKPHLLAPSHRQPRPRPESPPPYPRSRLDSISRASPKSVRALSPDSTPPPPPPKPPVSSVQKPPPPSGLSRSESHSQSESTPRITTMIPPPPPPPMLKTPAQDAVLLPPRRSASLTHDGRIGTWVERIKLMAEAVEARVEYVKIEKDSQGIQKLMHSWRYTDLPEEDKTRLAAQLATAETQLEAKKKELNSFVARLIDADFWPVLSKDSVVSIHGTIGDLQTQVKQLHDMVQKLFSQQSLPPAPLKEESPVPSSGRPAKRRRVASEEGEDEAADTSQFVAAFPTKDFERLQDSVLSLEVKLSEIENNLIQHDNDILDLVRGEVEAKFETLHPNTPPPTSLTQAPAPAITVSSLQPLQIELVKAGQDITEVVEEVADLVRRTNIQDQQLLALHEENNHLKSQVLLLQTAQTENLKALEAQKREIESLKKAVILLLTKSQPEPLPLPSIEEILAACQPRLVQAMKEDVQPLLEEMKRTVQSMLESQSVELCNVVLTKLATTLQTVQTITGWLDTVKQGSHVLNGAKGPKRVENSPAGQVPLV